MANGGKTGFSTVEREVNPNSMGQDPVCISNRYLQFTEVQNRLKTMNQAKIGQLQKGVL